MARRDPRKRYSATAEFQWPDPAIAPFRGLMPRRVQSHLGFIQHEVRVGDRLDRLAREYYDDPRLWWVIAEANPDIFFPAGLVYADEPAPDTGLARFRAGALIAIPARPETP